MEEKKDEEDSSMNEGEAAVALSHANRLVESGVSSSDIGVITPYAAQVWISLQRSGFVRAEGASYQYYFFITA